MAAIYAVTNAEAMHEREDERLNQISDLSSDPERGRVGLEEERGTHHLPSTSRDGSVAPGTFSSEHKSEVGGTLTHGEDEEKGIHHTPSSSNPEVGEKEKGEHQHQQQQHRPGAPADGGLKAWLAVLGAFLVLYATFGYANAFGVFQSYYRLNQLSNETDSNISWIGSIQLWLQFTCGIVSGPLYDKGHFRLLLGAGSTLYVFSLFMTSLCKTYWQTILAQGVGMGLGMGLTFLPAITVLSQHFAKKRSFAMGIATAGSSLGGVCFPIMLNKLFVSHGFEFGVRASAFLVLGCLAVANLVMTAPLPPHLSSHGAGPKPKPIDLFSEMRYSAVVLGGFFVCWGLFFPIFYLQVFAEVHGVGQNLAFYSLAILNGASIFGRTLPNLLSDKFGPMNMIIPCCAVSGVIIFAMFGATSPGGVVVVAILYGFFSGAYVSLLGPSLISLANNFSEIGMRIGMGFLVIGLAALTGTPIAGALLVRTNNGYYAPIIFSGLSVIVGTCLFILGRSRQAIEKQTWKV